MNSKVNETEEPVAFSVVLPLYNKESSVYQTVQSILEQSYSALQLIVVDDGSTDGSVGQLAGIDDERFLLIRQSNAGVSAARNAGVEAARYRHVAFIDADDLWHRDFLSIMNQLIQQNPGHDCYATLWEPWSRNNELPNDTRTYQTSSVALVDYIEESFDDVIAHICSTVVSKEAFLAVGGFPVGVKYFEDQDFMCKLARKSRMLLYQDALVYYVRDADNRACDRRQLQDMPPFFESNESLMLESFPEGSADWHFKEFLVTRYLSEFSMAAQTEGERGRALKWLLLCRKTQRSRNRLFKGFVYLMLPAKLITAFVSRVSKTRKG